MGILLPREKYIMLEEKRGEIKFEKGSQREKKLRNLRTHTPLPPHGVPRRGVRQHPMSIGLDGEA